MSLKGEVRFPGVYRGRFPDTVVPLYESLLISNIEFAFMVTVCLLLKRWGICGPHLLIEDRENNEEELYNFE